ncbi:hypothetical protein V1477_019735 [Vespula maculifrons]|uniref:Large ribosomal subunit protein mL46 n=2 Tax=Vespula TaxID=7451 RepID=A0ABD2ARA6_VESMC|nr:39S ribosomal protein L46, mitochondrial isoform X2 [Vespula vulgaris]
MFKQAFKASLKFDVSLSILKEVKNTFSASQWHCKRLINTSSKSKWDLLSAVCLERHPIITKPMNEIETNYYNLLKRIEYENSMKSDHELKLEKEKLEQKQPLESNIADTDIVSLQTAQEFEDSCQEELKNFQFASRITEFDKSNDKTSHMYKLDKTLVLLVEQNVNNIASWIPPQGLRKDGETMRQAAERVLQEFCGTEMTVRFYGNAPIGFHKYKYLEQNNKESDKCGAKVFYFLARYIDGSIASDKKYQWLSKEELRKTIPPKFYQHVSEFLIFE